MKEEPPSALLPGFFQYLRKVFEFSRQVAALRDARRAPDYSPGVVFEALFYGAVFRLGSVHQLEAELKQPFLRHWLGLDHALSEDTLRYSLSGFEVATLERLLVEINRQLKRNKALESGRVGGRLVAALDGVEVLSSESRCCEQCLQRTVWETSAAGERVAHRQYYHRVVGCQMVGGVVQPLLGLELVRSGEDEVAAAKRLLRKIPALYGSRFFDILLLDALYAQVPVLDLAQEEGWGLVVTLKQENRQVYQDAQGLFASRPPDHCLERQEGGQHRHCRLWEETDLPFSETSRHLVRVVRSQETLTATCYRGWQRQNKTTAQEWWWISTLSPQQISLATVWRLGHLRWKNENNGWNDLTQHWGWKHGFVHACRHRVPTPPPPGQKHGSPVPNQALLAVLFILTIAFVLFCAFTLLHSKAYRLYRPTLQEIARQLYRSLFFAGPPIRAPDS